MSDFDDATRLVQFSDRTCVCGQFAHSLVCYHCVGLAIRAGNRVPFPDETWSAESDSSEDEDFVQKRAIVLVQHLPQMLRFPC